MHDHYVFTCIHDLKHCNVCDVCYCTKCHREWGGYHPYSYIPYTYPYQPYQVWYSVSAGGIDDSSKIKTPNVDHSHT